MRATSMRRRLTDSPRINRLITSALAAISQPLKKTRACSCTAV